MLVQIQTRQPKLSSITHFWARMRAVSAALAATALAATALAAAAPVAAAPVAAAPVAGCLRA